MSEMHSPETVDAIRRDMRRWQARKKDARARIERVLSECIDAGLTPMAAGQILTGMATYGFRHTDGRWFGWDGNGWHREMAEKPEQRKASNQETRPDGEA